MKKINPKKGRSNIHSFACYDDVWKNLHIVKDILKNSGISHPTLDKALRFLIDFYNNHALQTVRDEKIAANKYFDKKIKEIKKDSKKM